MKFTYLLWLCSYVGKADIGSDPRLHDSQHQLQVALQELDQLRKHSRGVETELATAKQEVCVVVLYAYYVVKRLSV